MEIALIAVVFGLIGLGLFVVWVWTLVDVLKVPSDDRFRSGTQLIWVLVIVFTQIIGSIIYLAVGRPEPAMRR
jgi:hypothetical protein